MQPTVWWVAIVAAVASGVLIIVNAEWQRRQQGKAAAKKDREVAYIAFLTESFTFVHRAQALGLVKQFRSGLPEGMGILLRQRKSIDALDLITQFIDDAAPLYSAYSQIWLHGTQEAIDAADKPLATYASMLASLTASDSKRAPLFALLVGEGWSKAQQALHGQELARMSEQRVAFTRVVRKELGSRTVEFALERAQKIAPNHQEARVK